MAESGFEARFSEALMRAGAAGTHYATTGGGAEAQRCDRCHKPLNRWNEPCEVETTEAVLGRDFLALADVTRRYEAALRSILDVLGPEPLGDCPENRCEGCKAEMGLALTEAKAALQRMSIQQLRPCDVTACLVTRGDQKEAVDRILDSLIFDNAIVWDNSREEDWKCAGRYKAAELARTEVVYFQDDDVLVPQQTQVELLQAYEPDVCTANWCHGDNPDGYQDLPLVGGGAIVDKHLCADAINRYADHWPLDDAFRYEADFVVGALYPAFKHLHLPFHIDLRIAEHPSRLCNQPWQRDLKLEITNRARDIRFQETGKPIPFHRYLDDEDLAVMAEDRA